MDQTLNAMPRPNTAPASFLVGFVALSLAGCSGYDFQTRGVYEAPLSNLRFEVAGQGHVSPGEDVTTHGSGFVHFCPLSGSAAVPVLVTFIGGTTGVRWEISSPKPVRALMPWTVTNLEDRLRFAGHTALDAAELTESIRTVDSALAGPKGIVLRGQSARLSVRSTRILREKARAPAKPSTCSSI